MQTILHNDYIEVLSNEGIEIDDEKWEELDKLAKKSTKYILKRVKNKT